MRTCTTLRKLRYKAIYRVFFCIKDYITVTIHSKIHVVTSIYGAVYLGFINTTFLQRIYQLVVSTCIVLVSSHHLLRQLT